MNVLFEEFDSLILVRLQGDMDHAAAPKLYEELGEHVGSRIVEPVLLDFSGVPFLDSGGLSVLVRLLSRCDEDAWIGIISPNRMVFRLLNTAGLTIRRHLRVFRDLDEMKTIVAEEASRPAEPVASRPRRQEPLSFSEEEERFGDEEDEEDSDGRDLEDREENEGRATSGEDDDTTWALLRDEE